MTCTIRFHSFILVAQVAELRSSVHVLETRLHDMSRVHAEALEAQTATILAALKSGLTSSSIPRGMQTETDHVVLFKEVCFVIVDD